MEKTFIKITNKDIYKKLEDFIIQNQEEHKKICEHLIITNGKVKINTILSRSAMGLAILALSIITGINLFF